MLELTLEALVSEVDLESITFFEVSAVRSPLAVAAGEEDITPLYSLQTAVRDDDRGFRVRVRTELEISLGSIAVEVSADYQTTTISARAIEAAVMQEFVNGVALMALIPYIRQAVADITLRVYGAALTMPIVKRGEMEFDLSAAQAAAAKTSAV